MIAAYEWQEHIVTIIDGVCPSKKIFWGCWYHILIIFSNNNEVQKFPYLLLNW